MSGWKAWMASRRRSSSAVGARERGLALLDRDMADALRFIHAAVRRLSNVIDALLRLSRAGRVVYQWQHVDMRAMLTRIVESTQATIEERGATVIVRDLPTA